MTIHWRFYLLSSCVIALIQQKFCYYLQKPHPTSVPGLVKKAGVKVKGCRIVDEGLTSQERKVKMRSAVVVVEYKLN